jgi:U3 small nucleolar RNA-associated protein 13
VLKVHFLNNGTQLISTGSDGLIKLWNRKADECVGTFDEHSDKLWALCVSKDEMKFVSGGADGKINVWKDVTSELYEEEMEKRNDIILKYAFLKLL